MNKIIGNWNKTHVTDIGKATTTHILPSRVKNQPKVKHGTNVEQYQSVPRKFQGIDSETLRYNMYHFENVMMILTDFQKKIKQPEFNASRLTVVQIPVHPLLNSKGVINHP